MIRVNRCICFDRKFEDLKSVAEREGVETVDELQEHVTFGINCGLCRPYVARMLKTGQTLFTDVITEEQNEVNEKDG